MSESLQSTSSGWSPVVLMLAVAIPLFLFWRPLRYLINEYRLYRRCQQYPHIIVCKDSSAATSERNSNGIVGLITQIIVWLLRALLSFLGFVTNIFVTALTSKISKTESTTADQSLTELTGSSIETTTYSDTGSRVQSSSLRSHYHSSASNDTNQVTIVERKEPSKEKFHVPIQSEEIFASSPQTNEIYHHQNRKGLSFMTSKPEAQQSPSDSIRTSESTIRSRPQSQYPQTRIVPTATALATVTKPVVFDSSSLSEKMRKRRLNGERIMGYDAITGGGNEGQSRKRRKLSGGRMPLQGSTVRHPRVGAWQTTRILDKREREQREERLLRSLSRKRVKPTVEVSKPAPSTATSTSTAAPASSTPAFTFGQTPASTSTKPPTAAPAAAKQEAPAATSAPAPAFQFGASGSGTAEKKSEPAAKAPAFSFGNTSTSTAAAPDSSKAPAASAPAPAAPFQFGASSSGTSTNPTTKSQPTDQGAFKFGAAPAPATSSAPPSFGAAPSAPTPAAPSFGASTATSAAPAPSFGATSATPTPAPPAFGATPAPAPAAPTFGAAPAPSGFVAPAPAAPSFGSSTTTSFGAPAPSSQPPKPAAAPAFSFGNTKENTNPGGFNSSFQAPAPSNGFLKPQPTNTATPSFGGFSAGAPPASSSGASARRMARRAQRRRR